MDSLLLFGGTFDPIHCGHLEVAKRIQEYFHFDDVLFLPCKSPVLKPQASASAEQRLTMLQLALEIQNADYHFSIDESELRRDSPSYMVTTLEEFRCKHPKPLALNLLIGMDTFFQLPQWYQWQRLLSLCNILIVSRPGFSIENAPAPLQTLLDNHLHADAWALKQHENGVIYCWNAGEFDLSSSGIRKMIADKASITGLVPDVVIEYIRRMRLY